LRANADIQLLGTAAGELCAKLEWRVQQALPELARALMGGPTTDPLDLL
jgi:hypothetical protein